MKKTAFLLVFSLCALPLIAQYSFTDFHVGISPPTSDFKNVFMPIIELNERSNDGGASTGFTFGFQTQKFKQDKGFGWLLGVDVIHHSLSSGAKQVIDKALDEDFFYDDDFEVKFYRYLNLPLNLGLGYLIQPSSNDLDFIPSFGVCANVLKITDFGMSNNDFEATASHKAQAKFGIRMGLGVVYQDKYSFRLDYLNLGQYHVDGTLLFDDGDIVNFDRRLRQTMYTLTAGILLNKK